MFELSAEAEPNPFSAVFLVLPTLFNILFFGAIGRGIARIFGPNRKAFAVIPGVYNGPLAVWVAAAILTGALYITTPSARS